MGWVDISRFYRDQTVVRRTYGRTHVVRVKIENKEYIKGVKCFVVMIRNSCWMFNDMFKILKDRKKNEPRNLPYQLKMDSAIQCGNIEFP